MCTYTTAHFPTFCQSISNEIRPREVEIVSGCWHILLICSDLTQKLFFLPNLYAFARVKSASWCCLLVCFVCIGLFILKNSWILCAVSMSDFLPAWSSLSVCSSSNDNASLPFLVVMVQCCLFCCFPVVSLSLCFMCVPRPSFPVLPLCVCVTLLGGASWLSSPAVCTWAPAADHLIYSSVSFPDCCLLCGTSAMTYFLVY